MHRVRLKVEIVKVVPEQLAVGTLYVSREYEVAIHLCACGCGHQVVTPIDKGGWTLTEDANGVTLMPSIGNYQIPCKSHYWIRNSEAVPA